MSGSSFDVTTIIFAALALFVVWKLRSVLGTRHEHDQRSNGRPDRTIPGQPRNDNESQPLEMHDRQANRVNEGQGPDPRRWEGLAQPGSAVWNGLDRLDEVERGFDAYMFAEGSKGAYEMIVTAFAAGDRGTLHNLLSKEVMDSFDRVISERETNGETVETTFVSLDDHKIEDVQVRDKVAHITVAFQSKLISATYDREKKLIDGDPEQIIPVTDVWTFARDIGSNDPNWRLVAT